METKTLSQKLLSIRKQIPSIGKDGKNEHQKYEYVSSSKILGVLRKLMDEEGILLEPSIHSARVTPVGKQLLTELTMSMTWKDVKTLDKLIYPWYAQGMDMGEKGVGKALTYAEKYFLLKYFNIPTDQDDPDRGQKEEQTGKKKTDSLTDSSTVVLASDEQLEKIAGILMISECGKETAKTYLVDQGVITNNNARTMITEEAQKIIDNQDDFLNAVAKWNTQKTEE